MIVGKWNKSVIITYVGVIFSVIGMYLALTSEIKYAFSCLIVAGVCDLFDGTIARRCKRNEEEKQFGVELDSMADLINFISLPIIIFIGAGFTGISHLIVYIFFAICGVARLAYFNIQANSNQSIPYYNGLPVTYTALILPLVYLLSYVMKAELFNIIFPISLLITSILNVLKIKIAKPRGLAYGFFSALAIIMLIVYLVVL